MTHRDRRIHPWDDVLVHHWAQTPEGVPLRSDPQGTRTAWRFGGSVRTCPSPLDDARFEVYVDKVWALIQDEAARMPARRRRPFLADQQRRIDDYRAARARQAGGGGGAQSRNCTSPISPSRAV